LTVKTILIVDDSRTTRDYHSAIVSSAGYRVVMASDGADGLERLLMHPCDLILTDINMQGIDGYEFIRRVRAIAGHDTIPIVILSTEGQDKDKSKGYAAGANLYVVKPSNPDALLEYVSMMLGGQT
jgi:two-component system, chemotaxis family, chemotaxis protein CheY